MRRHSLQGKLAAVLVLAVAAGVALGVLLGRGFDDVWTAGAVALLIALPFVLGLARWLIEPVALLLRGLTGLVDSYRDGDFSISLATDRRDELGDLTAAHNQLGSTLREQRQGLVQRELLLDTVVQNTPVALVLTDEGNRVAYANLAARHLFNEGRAMNGHDFTVILDSCPEALRTAVASGEDALFGVEIDGAEEMYHVSGRAFRLTSQPHRLLLFRRMTRELSRQEVATWKKLIRVISHELNNSLAPISSLAHSGAELARRGDLARVGSVFGSIGERARHLHGFIDGYATFAKLPTPRLEKVGWRDFVDSLQEHGPFVIDGPVPDGQGRFDRAQLEQVLINLLRNAHESGSPTEAVSVSVQKVSADWRIEVRDAGPGMSEQVLANALLPFYSTKRSGTGLGLALAREIIEAHGGRITLGNREGGGLRVMLSLPD
ncbi:sensor histidine kinase [Nevskia ramosa]|uniref:sensor histidine kinase n=1 Tax=Nevskia ramosa TaxID=64002 RepID=UPI0003B5D028|nr:ATP-binding protein [Nevskia ramosa]